jgi:hypothetical protein
MKFSTTLLTLFASSPYLVEAFSILPSKEAVFVSSRPTTALKYTIMPGIEEEDDFYKEPEAKPVQKLDANGMPDLSGYRDKDADFLTEIDKDLNVDAFSNSVSGGIMGSGVQLSALCGDD